MTQSMTWIGFISIMVDKRERKIDKAVPKNNTRKNNSER
jgi:hypothetical protein